MSACREFQGRRTKDGYGRVVHRWVFERLDGPLVPGEVVMHTCDNPPCFLFEHLRRGTPKLNDTDMRAKGREAHAAPRGSQHGQAKLTEQLVSDLRRRYATGGVSQRALAREAGISQTQIRSVLAGRHWRHVDVDLS